MEQRSYLRKIWWDDLKQDVKSFSLEDARFGTNGEGESRWQLAHLGLP